MTTTMPGVGDERELLLGTLAFLRDAILAKLSGLDDDQARWTPPDALIPLIGIVHHLTRVEWRWIDGLFLGVEVSRSEEEFKAADVTLAQAISGYRERAAATERVVRDLASLDEPGLGAWGEVRDARWVLVHLIQETARHAGHADATRELLDGTTGEGVP